MAKEFSPGDYARHLFSDDLEEHAKQDPINPGTGSPSYLAREVMAEALMSETAIATSQVLSSPFDYFTAAKSLTRDPPIVEGWVFRDVVHTVIAAPGVGKSFLGLMIGWAAVLGRDPRTGKPVPSSHAFVLMGEDAAAEVAARSRACVEHQYHLSPDDQAAMTAAGTRVHIRAGAHLPLVELDQKKQAIVPKITPGLRNLCDWLEMVIALKDGKPVTIVLDMMRHAYVGDDNARGQIDGLFRVLRCIMSALARHGVPAGIVLTHHKTKASSRSGDSTFSAAGSIGIEGNSRMVTHVGTRGGDEFLEVSRVKTNYGRTGTREFFRKVVVPSSLGGDTLWMDPVDEATATGALQASARAFQLQDMVEALHRHILANGTVIGTGTRIAKGSVSVRDALRATPEGASASDADARDVVDAGTRCGAWTVGRVVRGGAGTAGRVDVRAGLVCDETWQAPERDAAGSDET
jgi:hypothetical protein